MHVADGRYQLSHDAAGLCFAEMLLPANPLQQFPSTQQLQNQVRVKLWQTHRHTQTRRTYLNPVPACVCNMNLVQTRERP